MQSSVLPAWKLSCVQTTFKRYSYIDSLKLKEEEKIKDSKWNLTAVLKIPPVNFQRFLRIPSIGHLKFLQGKQCVLAHLSWALKAFLITICPASVCMSVCPSFCSSVCKSFTFLVSSQEPCTDLILPNLEQSILDGGDSSLLNWRATPFYKGK